jgi:phosphocarrier protein
VTIQNQLGLHARPAMAFVDLANRFHSEIQVSKGAQTVDGKSIMQMMMLAATKGTKLEIHANGADAEQATNELVNLVNRKFDED